jgi:uncharacterized membrane protein
MHYNTFKKIHEKLGGMDRVAMWITDHIGTMGFFLIIFCWTVLWLGWNSLAPKALQFDPPMGFVLWLFVSNMIQILLMPLIMIGQNLQSRHTEARAEYDLQVNLKSEKEITAILSHLERQNRILMVMVKKMDIEISDIN